jgi:uncharacterized repeat protein (TIGR03803 family)
MRKFNSSTQASTIALAFTTLFLISTSIALSAQVTVIQSFAGFDGDNSQAALLQTMNGQLYGTTVYGGKINKGTVFEVTTSGVLTTLHSFLGPDGANPWPALVNGHDGFFYGTTNYGGSGTACGSSGCGTVFRITPTGTLTTLHSFNATDGANPQGGLVQGTDGNFYGATLFDAGGSCVLGCGTIFKISPTGAFTTLHSFTGGADGGYVYAALIQATDGNFYGVTFTGGSADEGTVFQMTPSGTVTTIHNFCTAGVPCPDGGNALGGLVQASDGNLYGTAPRGGDASCSLGGYDGCGTIFRITLGGTFTLLHDFHYTDGAGPLTRMVQGTDGFLYGVTTNGGSSSACSGGCGTIYRISTSGPFSLLYNFCSASGCTDGATPVGGLIQGIDGKFYGTTAIGGASNMGEVYSLP